MNTQTNFYMLWTGRILAVIGMFFPIAGNFMPPTQRPMYFVLGGVLMALATVIEKAGFFFVLQCIVVIGALMNFVEPLALKIIIPCLVSFAFIVYCYQHDKFKDRSLILGVTGISLLSLGYGVGHPLIYLLGGFTLAIYSWIAYRQGVKIAIMWAVLNAFFTLAVLYNILHYSLRWI